MADNPPDIVDGLPNLCGHEDRVAEAMARPAPVALPESDIDFARLQSGCAVALHMHQPLIPAGDGDRRSARIIGNLQYMMEHLGEGDNHNAPVFRRCYRRMGEFVPELVADGRRPRIMLEYSGCLLYGLRQMGAGDVLDALRRITVEPDRRRCVEWLGMPWGHPVAPSTPMQDFRLHVGAWQHHFASLFGWDALARVRGFSPSEMALPNHPDVCYEFLKAVKDAGYRWILVQEHTVERAGDGGPVRQPHRPHRLVAKNSRGQTVGLTAVIKTQGSDTKLVGQMQPFYEARGLERIDLQGRSVPPVVTQISDGENGNVIMNEFPDHYRKAVREADRGAPAMVNITEYLEYLDSLGIDEGAFPAVQPIMQQRIWDRFDDGAGPEALAKVIAVLEREDPQFHTEGGSWTMHISWTEGYGHVLTPMESVSSLFADKVLDAGVATTEPRYRRALFHLLCSQTSCYRYWGEGRWTDYGRELCRRLADILNREF